MPNQPDKPIDELRELYSDENLSRTVRDILHKTNAEFDIGSDEYDENLKSRYLLLCKRVRDNFKAQEERAVLEARIDEREQVSLSNAELAEVDYKYPNIGFAAAITKANLDRLATLQAQKNKITKEEK